MPLTRILLILALISMSSLSFANDIPERKNDFLQKVTKLKAKAKSRKKIPVIVRLKAPFKPEGRIGKRARQQQRNVIRRIRNSVRQQMTGMMTTEEAIINFEQLPYIALQASPQRIERLRRSPHVISIEEDFPVKGTLDTSIPLTNGNTAFSQSFSGAGQTIAVIDTGVRTDHEFFAGKIVSEACFSGAGTRNNSLCPGNALSSLTTGSANDCDLSIDGCGHGTHVAGIAVGANAQFSGVAKDANLIALKTATLLTDRSGNPFISHFNADLASALMRVYELRDQYKIAAVNMSLGNSNLLEAGTCDTISPLVTDAINLLNSVGIATVIASGNTSQTNRMTYPACISNAVSVGNTVSELQTNSPTYRVDDVWIDSNISAETDLLAPGTRIYSAGANSPSTYLNYWGTSMAAPHVAGAFAVLRSKNPNTSVSTLLTALQRGGLPRLDQRSGGLHTTSRIDIANALAFIESDTATNDTSTSDSTIPAPVPPPGDEVNTTTPTLSWSAIANTDTYTVNAWSGEQPLSTSNQIIGNVVTAGSAGCAQASATTCTYTFTDKPFPDNEYGNWMVRAGSSGQDSTPIRFKVKTSDGDGNTSSAEPVPLSPINGTTVNTALPELSWRAKANTTSYIINAWTGQQPLSSSNQVIGNVVNADAAGCGQNGAITCTYTFTANPFPDKQTGNWMVRAGSSGPDSTPATFELRISTAQNPTPTITNACQQGNTAVSFAEITPGQALCLKDIANRGQAQLHIYVYSQNVGRSLLVQTAHGNGEGALLHLAGRRPTSGRNDNIADTAGTDETMTVTNLKAGWNYIHFSTSSGYSGVSLMAEFQ